MADKLAIDTSYHVYRIMWICDGEEGGFVGDDWGRSRGMRVAPADRSAWEAWAVDHAAAASPGVLVRGNSGFEWETLRGAKAALRLCRSALKSERPWPDWAKEAAANGWKPPKGWRS